MINAVKLHILSDLSAEDAERLIGKKIVGVEGDEFMLLLRLDDGSTLQFGGSRREGVFLGVSYTPKQG